MLLHTHTLSVLLSSTALPSPSVCVGDGPYMYVEVFQAAVCICLRTYGPSRVNIHMHNDPEVCNKKNKQLLFARSCYRVWVRVCARNPIILQCVLSAASWKSAAELRGCFSCVGEFARMYTCALNTSAPIQRSFLHLLLRAKKIPPELYASGRMIINPMTLKVWHTWVQASTTGKCIKTRSKRRCVKCFAVQVALCPFEPQFKSIKTTPWYCKDDAVLALPLYRIKVNRFFLMGFWLNARNTVCGSHKRKIFYSITWNVNINIMHQYHFKWIFDANVQQITKWTLVLYLR